MNMDIDTNSPAELKKKLALAFIVKNEGRYALDMIQSVLPIVGFVSCLDTGSTDGTPTLVSGFLQTHGIPHRVDSTPFSRFDIARNDAIRGVPDRFEWIVMLDADEIMLEKDYPEILQLVSQSDVDAWDLPRFNWIDKIFGNLTPAYPDYQGRLFRNSGAAPIRYRGELHEVLAGYSNKKRLPIPNNTPAEAAGVHIHHVKLFQKSLQERRRREEFYQSLYKAKIREFRKPYINKIWRGIEPFENAVLYRGREDFQGWNSGHPYLTSAAKEVRQEIVVDIGVWKGGSTLTMANALREIGHAGLVIAVDTWLGSWDLWLQREWFPSLGMENGYPTIYRTFMANVAKQDLQDYVLPLPLDSVNAAGVLKRLDIRPSVIHIDGGHDYDAVTTDLTVWWPLLTQGGILIGDDYHPEGKTWPEVKRAYDDFFRAVRIEHSGGKCRIKKV